MEENHIFINKDIGKDETEISLADIQAQYKQNASDVYVHINCNGGDVSEGKAIYDFLRGLKQTVHTIGEGMVASIATLPYLAGETREMKPNAEFLGHLPSMGIHGNSDDIEKANEYIQEKKEDIARIYSSVTGKSLDEMVEFMRLDVPISASKSKDMGFTTYIPEFKAIAYLNSNNIHKMETVKEKSKIDSISDKFIASVDKLILALNPKIKNAGHDPENVKLELEDGSMIWVQSEDGELEGKMAFMIDEDGNRTETPVAEGTHKLKDGRSITIDGDGVVVSVDEIVAKEHDDDEDEEAKAKIEELTAELVKAKQANTELTSKIEAKDSEQTKMTERLEKQELVTTEVSNQLKEFKNMAAGGEMEIQKAHIKPIDKNKPVVTNGHSLDGFTKTFFQRKK